jgi:hypothetical protein
MLDKDTARNPHSARSARTWRVTRALDIAVAALMISAPFAPRCLAQDMIGPPTVEADVQPEISRDEWRQKVQEAKRRAAEAAVERRNHPDLYVLPPEDPEQVATERVLNDESLQRGDIVATKKGLFVFRGHSDHEHREDDFVALPRR